MTARRSYAARISDFFLSLFFSTCFFYILTGGAFLNTREHANAIALRPKFYLLVYAAVIALVLLAGLVRYRAGRNTFFQLEPFSFFSSLAALPAEIIISMLVCGYFATQWMTLSFMHSGLQTALWDVGFYDQMLWNTAHGKPLIVSVRGGLNLLGHHFEPIFLLLAPLYWFQDSIFTVFGFIALNGAANIVLVYLIANEILKSKKDAVLIALAVFFYQPLRNAVIFPIQSQVFADPFLLLGFLCILKNRFLLGLVPLILAVMCKESIVIDLLGIGLFVIYQNRKNQRNIEGWLILILAAASYFLIFRLIEPHYLWQNDPWKKWNFFSHLKHPTAETWKQLLTPNPFFFLFLVFAPMMFLALLCNGWFFLLGPSLLMRLLSNYGGLRLITAHYTSGLNALVFIAAIYGYARIQNYLQRPNKITGTPKQQLAVFRICFLVFVLLFAGKPQLRHVESAMWEMSYVENQKIIKLLNKIPKSCSVKTTEVFLAQLTHRPYIFSFTSTLPGSPYEEIDRNPDFLAVDELRIQGNEKTVLFDHLKHGYKLIIKGPSFSIYASPRLDSGMISELRVQWERIQKEEEIPYRKIVRKWYKRFLIAGLVLFLFTLARRYFR